MIRRILEVAEFKCCVLFFEFSADIQKNKGHFI